MERPQRYVVGMSGATGSILGVRLLQELRAREAEVHLVASPPAIRTLDLELPDWPWSRVKELAHVVHDHRDIAASIASGSYPHDGMIIAPCSISSVAAIAHGLGENLLVRAADVTLKERRPLIVMAREAPLHLVHLRNLAAIAELGGIVLPPLLAFYQQPKSVMDLVDHVVGKALDLLRIPHDLYEPWEGPARARRASAEGLSS